MATLESLYTLDQGAGKGVRHGRCRGRRQVAQRDQQLPQCRDACPCLARTHARTYGGDLRGRARGELTIAGERVLERPIARERRLDAVERLMHAPGATERTYERREVVQCVRRSQLEAE